MKKRFKELDLEIQPNILIEVWSRSPNTETPEPEAHPPQPEADRSGGHQPLAERHRNKKSPFVPLFQRGIQGVFSVPLPVSLWLSGDIFFQ